MKRDHAQFAVETVLKPVLWSIALGTVVTVLLFVFALKPQANAIKEHIQFANEILSEVGDAVAELIAFGLVLLEAMVLVVLFFKVRYEEVSDQIREFALTKIGALEKLRQHGIDEIPELSGGKKGCRKVQFTLIRLTLAVLTLPLHAWVGFGSVIWYILNGWLYSWDALNELLTAFNLDNLRKQCPYAGRNFGTLAAFGAVALLLETIPFLGVAFACSNAYGSGFLFLNLMSKKEKWTIFGRDETDWSYQRQ